MIVQTTYEVKKAHSNMNDKVLKSSEKMVDIVNWLRRKSNPFNYDVIIFNYSEGDDSQLNTETGDEFIAIYERGCKVSTF